MLPAQVHLSHNSITAAGAAALLAAVPAPPLPPTLPRMPLRDSPPPPNGSPGRSAGNPGLAQPQLAKAQARTRPLWLRLEWNHVEGAALDAALAHEEERRGLVADIPGKREDGSRGHEQNLVFSGAPSLALCSLLWIALNSRFQAKYSGKTTRRVLSGPVQDCERPGWQASSTGPVRTVMDASRAQRFLLQHRASP